MTDHPPADPPARGPRISLPSFGAVQIPSGPPSIDEARAHLGGRADSGAGAGRRVRVEGMRAGPLEGVVVYASGDELDVWIGGGRFARVSSGACQDTDVEVESLAEVARAAARFAALREGDAVTYLDRAGASHVGVLLEKCRYGALVSSVRGTILAVGFQRVSPAPR